MAADTLLINGVDVRAQTGIIVKGDLASILYPPGTLRGSNPVVPGARGEIGADLPLAAYQGDVVLRVKGATRAVKTTNLRAFLAVIRSSSLSALCTLERRLDNGSGYDVSTAHGQIVGDPFTLWNPYVGLVQVTIKNLDGAWTTDGGTTWEAW